jgi:DnaK suppressor protein
LSIEERERYRVILRARLQELAASDQDRVSIAVERSTDLADELERSVARDMALNNLARRFSEIRLVEAALDRITDGTYGICSGCDAEISKKRMAARPGTGLCITCQEAEEQTNNGPSQPFETSDSAIPLEDRHLRSKAYRF